jgi:hypothetical protein
MILQSDIDRLETVSHSEFEVEAQHLIGRSAYEILLQNGMDRREMTDEIRRMAGEEANRPAAQTDLFKDAAAQCHA